MWRGCSAWETIPFVAVCLPRLLEEVSSGPSCVTVMNCALSRVLIFAVRSDTCPHPPFFSPEYLLQGGGGGWWAGRGEINHMYLSQAGPCKLSVETHSWCQLAGTGQSVCSDVISCLLMSDSCNPMDCSPPGCLSMGILQARILEWVAMPLYRGPSQPGTEPMSPAFQADSLPSEPPGKTLWFVGLDIRKQKKSVLLCL